MKDIAIYGFGGLGKEVACIIQAINQVTPTWNLIGYFDDGVNAGETNKYGKVIGNMDTLNCYNKVLAVVLAIASPDVLLTLVAKIKNPLLVFPTIVAPNVFFFDQSSITFGQGNIIGFGVRISCYVSLGEFNILNGCTSLGHDVSLGNYNVLQPETRISGQTKIGNNNHFGARSLVLQGIKIGNKTRIGVGSIIIRNTKDNMFYWGNPAKIIKE